MANNFMNYNGYNPYGSAGMNYGYTPTPYYTPYQQTTSVPQTQPQPQAQTQPQTITNTNEIFVNGIDDVRNRPLPTNSNYIFLDNDKALLYEKIVDSRGQFEVKTYEIREISGQERQKDQDTINSSDYVKTGDLDPLKAEIKALKDKITKMSVQNQIDEIKKGDK